MPKKVGKRLYVHRTALSDLSKAQQSQVRALARKHPDFRWTVARVGDGSVMLGKTESFSKTFHPALIESVTQAKGKTQHRVYGDNPPIYHRIEQMLSSTHPRYASSRKNTEREEEKGLLSRPDIGTRESWNRIRGARNRASSETRGGHLSYSRSRFHMTDQQILKLLVGVGIGGGILYLALAPKKAKAAVAPGQLPAPPPGSEGTPTEPEVAVPPVVAVQQPGQPAPIPPPVVRDELQRTLLQAGVSAQLALPTSISGLSVVHVGTMRPRPSQGQVRRMQRKGLIPPRGSSGVARRGKKGRTVREQVSTAIKAVIEHHRVHGLAVPGTPVYIVRKALKDLGPNTPRRWKRRFGWEDQWFVGFVPVGGFHTFRVNAIQSRNRSLADIRPVGGVDYGPVQTKEIAITEKVLKALMEGGAPFALKVLEEEQQRLAYPDAPAPVMPPPPTTQEMEAREEVEDQRAADEAEDEAISESDGDLEDAERVVESREQAAAQQPQAATVPRVVQGNGGWVYRQHPNGTIEIVGAPSGYRSGATLTSGAAWVAITDEIGPHPGAPQAPSGAPRIVAGNGGYKYEQHPSGAIRILVDPTRKATGVTLTSGRAHRAITREIGPYPTSGTGAPPPPAPVQTREPGSPRDVTGAGGWTYRQYPDSSIEIVGAPSGHRTGAVLRSGTAWAAITSEIGPYPTQMGGHFGGHRRRRRAG